MLAIRKLANCVRRKKLPSATRSLHLAEGAKCKNVLSAAASHSGSLKFAMLRRNETSRQRLFHPGGTPVPKKKEAIVSPTFRLSIAEFTIRCNFRRNGKFFFFFFPPFFFLPLRERWETKARLLANKVHFIIRRANIIALCAAAATVALLKAGFVVSDEFRSKVACENEVINLVCHPGQRVAIFSASFGRTQYESLQCPQPLGVQEESKCHHQLMTNTLRLPR